MDYKMEELEIKEELMIYIANHLPFVAKGSFLTSQYHKDPQARLLNGGDIDLIYHGGNGTIPKLCTFDYDGCTQFLQEVETLLKHDLVDIFYKLEEIMTQKLELTERPQFILELEDLGYDRIFKESNTISLFLVNYAADGDFTTVGLEICDRKLYVEIDIAIDMPIHFQPETILYKTMTGKKVTLKNTTPLIYQTAWKIHQILVRPRLKDLDDVIRFLPHIDFEDRHNFELFFDEIISECELTDEKTCKTLIDTLKRLFDKQIQSLVIRKIENDWARIPYYSKLYNMYYDIRKLENEIYSCFLKALHSKIDCDAALEYINRRFYDSCNIN